MAEKNNFSRRQFLKGAAAAAVGATFSAPLIIPSRALGADGAIAPSNRITMGCIGVGGMGTGNMQCFLQAPEVRVVAVCDVDKEHRDKAKTIVDDYYTKRDGRADKGCATYNDFRELLARPDIDAVMVATPDHWHALVAVAAAKAGKDMYCEKPLGLTIAQGRIMSDTINKYGRVFQTGSWQRSTHQYLQACELVRNGRIGQVHTIYVGLPEAPNIDVVPEEPVPAGFDYNMWLGPAPWAPYNKARCHWNFRYNLDYSGGHVTDWGAHNLDIAQWGLGTEYSGPVEMQGKGVFPKNGFFNTAMKYKFECKYANGVRMITSDAFENGIRFEGSEGWVFVSRERIDASPKALLGSVILPQEIHLYRSPGHYQNFIDCIRSRQRTAAPVEIAHRSITIAHLANIAMLLERKIRWDPAKEEIINDPEASRMLSRGMRSPWQLS